MKKNKLFTFLLAIIFILGSIGFCFAEGENSKVTKYEAKLTADKMIKDVFGITVDDKKFESSIEYGQDYGLETEYVWYIDYASYNDETDMDIRVTINANTGKVVGLYKDEYDNDEQESIVSITEDEAKDIGEKFIESINPSEFKNVKFVVDKSFDEGNYNFKYTRVINGIELDRNYIEIKVDGKKGNIVGYHIKWNDSLNVPSSNDVISSEKANEIFKKETKLNLSYLPYVKDSSARENIDKVKLVYIPNLVILDAKKGSVINDYGNILEEGKIKDLDEKEKESFLEKYKEPVKPSKEISKDEASSIIYQIKNDIFGSDYEIESIEYIEGENCWEKNVWSAEVLKKGEHDEEDTGEITIDALTKDIIYIDRWYYSEMNENKKPTVSFDEAYYKAIDVIAKYFPSKIKEIDTKEYNTGNDEDLYFYFERNINGIAYKHNSICIYIDNETGNVLDIRVDWDDASNLPDVSKVINEEKAKDIYLKDYKPKLVYKSIDKSEDYLNPNIETMLVYNLDSKSPDVYIDAVSGVLLDYSGEEVEDISNEFNEKIKGHWAEKTLNILASTNIIDTKDFDLNKDITKMQAIKMIVNAKDVSFKDIPKDSEEYEYLKMAVKYKLIEDKAENFNPNDKVTRQEMAKLLVNLMNYDKIAKSNDIHSLNFKDSKEVKSENIGYMAICKSLGVLEGNNGEIRPNDNATMVEMAVSIYKAMANMR